MLSWFILVSVWITVFALEHVYVSVYMRTHYNIINTKFNYHSLLRANGTAILIKVEY